MPADSAACARALVHTRTLAHAHEHDGLQGLSDMVPDGGREVGPDRVVPGRAAALCQPESGALQPAACGNIIIEKASSEDRRGHSPQTPRGGTPQGGKQHTGKPTRQQYLCARAGRTGANPGRRFESERPPRIRRVRAAAAGPVPALFARQR